jgi:hypothetical protein
MAGPTNGTAMQPGINTANKNKKIKTFLTNVIYEIFKNLDLTFFGFLLVF